jgi:hypothetical protein
MTWGSNPGRGKRFISSSRECPDWVWDPPSLIFNVYCGLFTGEKWLRHKDDPSPLVQILLSGAIPPLAPYDFMISIRTISPLLPVFLHFL